MISLLLGLGLLAGDASEERGEITLRVGDATYEKRHVLRYPEASMWKGTLVVGAHGGRGGEAYDREGRVTGTDETALDDVAGRHALERGFAYASLDRDGIGGTREGLELTRAFTAAMEKRLAEVLGREVERTYLVGLSMGGGIARYAAEESGSGYDGVLIVAGAHGDAAGGRARRERMALAWPAVDPRDGDEPTHDALSAYAVASGTPLAARPFWPFLGSSAAGGAVPASEEPRATGELEVKTIEVAGTFDDFVLPEIRSYRENVVAAGREALHRLYLVRGAWHISPDDDAIASFQFLGARMGLAPESVEAMARGASYLPTVREALDLLDAWVSDGAAPPASRELDEGQRLAPAR